MDTQLEEMRQQLDILKEKLQQQEIVNDQVVRNAIVGNLRKLEFSKWAKLCLILFGLVYVPSVLYFMLHIDLWFIVLTALFFAVAAIYDFYFMNGINANNMSAHALVETSRRLVRMKQMNARWLWFSIPVLALWLIGFFYLMMNQGNLPHELVRGVIFGGIIGLFLGGVLGTIYYLKQQRRAQDLIDQIEEFVGD